MTTTMRDGLGVLGAAGIGIGLMYLLDPERGNRRRMFIRDKIAGDVHFFPFELAGLRRRSFAWALLSCSS